MSDFPPFTKHALNRIARSSQFTDDVEGYVFDGADGSQVAFWTSKADRPSAEHMHAFDEYILVVEGVATLIVDAAETVLTAGMELVVPEGTTLLLRRSHRRHLSMEGRERLV